MKQTIAAALRSSGLMPLAEQVRFHVQRARQLRDNRAFRAEYPNFATPPDALLYEISSNVDYRMHRRSGEKWARRFLSHIERHIPDGPLSVYDWGCGVGRVVRHLPTLCPRISRAVGSDYDGRMIEWCRRNIPGVEFAQNHLMPPTPFRTWSFDAAFSYSVFTHLSETAHHAWVAELERVVRPGGVVLFTTMGDACRPNLRSAERAAYDRGELVVRTVEREGGRCFAAYASPRFVRERLIPLREVLVHEPASGGIAQDLWVVRV